MLGYLIQGAHTTCAQKESSLYKPFDGGFVLMGNDAMYKTIGIDNIRIRIFDGQLQTLKIVRHIPDLKKNLLSFGAWKA